MARTADTQHPASWWLFAALLAVSMTCINTLGFTLTGIVCCVTLVALCAYSESANRNFRVIALASFGFVALRVLLQNLFGYPMGSDVLFTVPSAQLPQWLAGIRIGGAVTSESLLYALNDGMRIAGIAIAFTCAASITSPTRVLRALPMSLHSAGMLLVIAVTFLPHLLADLSRIRHAARWRGQRVRGIRSFAAQLINIAESALDRSVTLAAALTARGYVHSNAAGTKRRLLLASAFCLLFFATGLVVFGYSPQILVGGLLSATMMWFGFEATNRSNVRTRYRANTWDLNSVLLAASPVLALAVFFAIDSQTAGTQTTWLASAAALTLGLTFIKRTEIWHATSSRHAEVES